MPDYCPYAYLIPWTTEGHAYAKKVREKKERDLARKAACRKQKKLVLGRMANAPMPPRPALVRVPALVPPTPAVVVAMARPEESAPEALTTCYQGRYGSCWTEE